MQVIRSGVSLKFWGTRSSARRALCAALKVHAPLTSSFRSSFVPFHSLPHRSQPSGRRALQIMSQAVEAPVAAPAVVDVKLDKIRSLMATADNGKPVHAIIVPSEDPHMSEYPPDCDARRAFISGFDGSAGTVVITTEAALLWTDGRYFLQAESQLGPGWTLMRHGTPACPEIADWLVATLPEGATVGVDPMCHTIDAAGKLAKQLTDAGKHLLPLSTNLVDKVWGEERPAASTAPLRVHALEWAGVSVADKLADLRNKMREAGAGATMVTMLDEVAWLLNLRGGDVSYNPVFLSYVIVTPDGATLYIDPSKVVGDVAAHLTEAGVSVKPYDQAISDVRSMAAAGVKIWMDPSKVSYGVKLAALQAASSAGPKASPSPTDSGKTGSRKRSRQSTPDIPSSNGTAPASKSVVLEKSTPIAVAKACKNEAELAGFREAHIRDGIALSEFLCWIEKEIAGGRVLTECEVDEALTARRAAQPGFIELSFPTIAGSGSNGAIIHYRPMPDTCKAVDGNSLLLLDSGGQYDCGTTDITRTMHFGTPTEHQKACYTAVLQGHIALDTVVYPENTPGCALDALARTPLWRMGLNYRHGTGHGVGAALNVHEGPQSISSRFWNTQPLLKNMVCSNEPGYYEDGSFGIRIENLFIVKEADTDFRYGGDSYLTSDSITVCPIQKKLINKALLTPEEVTWVDGYHVKVWETLSPRMQPGEVLDWLKEATSPL